MSERRYDYLIVGSGLFGATIAYRLRKAGKKCLVIEKRSHLGGNVYCEEKEGIHVHKYGAHIFHTSSKHVWNFVNSFVEFNRYTNSPVAYYKGKLYNLPFNMNTFYQMWGVSTPAEAMAKIESQKMEAVAKLKVIKRLPLRFVFDNNYFNDKYQGIPIGGYNKLIAGLLEGVEVLTNVDYFEDRSRWDSLADKIVFTGKIDEFYNYKFGMLQYRTVYFEEETINCVNYQGNAVVNYTDSDVPYTRIIEHKHFEMFGNEIEKCPKTIISKEYSTEWSDGMEPYYPINDERNDQLANKYKELAAQEKRVVFGGRLAEYSYYDMAPVIERALSIKI